MLIVDVIGSHTGAARTPVMVAAASERKLKARILVIKRVWVVKTGRFEELSDLVGDELVLLLPARHFIGLD